MADNMAGGSSQVMDERIVAAKFDSEGFEKGVDKTIKKLDELKKSLNMKDSDTTITEIANKTKEASESTSKSLEKLTDRYTTFVGMIKQKLLSGLADQVVSVFFRMERAILSFAKSMSFDQISNGMAKYEEALTSVRMIVNSYKTVRNDITGELEKIHYTQDEAYSSIRSLQDYADETSYSMSQMTDAMSKMVAAGVDLNQAEKNVQGIANACAAAGVNAQEASRAFFNLSQAYSSGALKYTDYRSLELLNMTNENFQDQLLAAGVAAGTLKESKDKNGNTTYTTQKSKTNKKITAGKKITKKQLTESLKYGWADNDVMDALFGKNFYVDVEDFRAIQKATNDDNGLSSKEKTAQRKEYLASLKDMEAIEKYFSNLGDNNGLKKYYEKLGNSEERKKYIDTLSDEADEIAKVSHKYGAIDDSALKNYLNGLADTDKRKQAYRALKTDKERKEYLDQLKKDQDVLNNVQGKIVGYDLEALEKWITESPKAANLRDKWDAMNDKERKQYLKDLADGASSVAKLGRKYSDAAIEAFLAAREARNLNDVINAIGDYVSSKWTKVFENLIGQLDDAADFFTSLSEGGIAEFFYGVADFVEEASDSFNDGGIGSQHFRDSILSLDGALGNLLGTFTELMDDPEAFGESMMVLSGEISVALDNFNNWTGKYRVWLKEAGRKDSIKEIFANLSGIVRITGRIISTGFQTIGHALETLSPIANGIIAALDKITAPIGRLGDAENTEPFDKLQQAIANVFKIIDPAVGALSDVIPVVGDILGTIGDFFIQGSIDTIVANITLFADALGLFLEAIGIDSAQKEAGVGVLEGIKNQITELGNACMGAIGAVGSFFKSIITDLRTLFGLETKDGIAVEDGGIFANIRNFFDTNEFIQSAKTWIANAKTDVTKWFETAVADVQTWFDNLPQTIGDAINQTFFRTTEKSGEGTDEAAKESAEETLSPFRTWLDGLRTGFDTWFEQAKTDIGTWLKEFPTKISEFFTGFFYTTTKYENGVAVRKISGGKYEVFETPLKQWLDGAIESVSSFIANVPTYLAQALGDFGDLIVSITDALFAPLEGKEATSKKEKTAAAAAEGWASRFVTGIKDAIVSIPGQVKKFLGDTKERFKKVFANIKTWLNESETGKAIKEFGATITNGIKAFILSLPETIKNFIKSIGSLGRDIIGTIKELFGGGDLSKEIQNGIEDEVGSISLTGVLASIADIGATIVNQFLSWFTGTDDVQANIDWFFNTIVGFITSIPGKLWDEAQKIGEKLNGVWSYIVKQFTTEEGDEVDAATGVTTADEFAAKHPTIVKLIDAAVAWIKSIPESLESAYTEIAGRISGVWNDIGTILTRQDRIAEIQAILNDRNNRPSIADRREMEAELANLQKETDFEKNHPQIASWISSAADWITHIPENLSAAYETMKKDIGTFWAQFIEFWKKDPESEEPTEFEGRYSHLSKIITSVRQWIESIPETLGHAWSQATEDLNKFFNGVTSYWSRLDRIREINEELNDLEKMNKNVPKGKTFQQYYNQLTAEREALYGENRDYKNHNPILGGAIESLNGFLADLPGNIETAFNTATSALTNFWNDLVAAFNGENLEPEKDTDSQSLGQKIRGRIISFFANLPTYITEGINAALELINKAFSGITTLFAGAGAEGINTDQITTAVEGSLQTVSDATKEVMEKAEKDVGDTAGKEAGDTPSQGFAAGIVKIGETFWEIITKTVPAFITSGFEWVRDNWETTWKPSLLGIFSKVTGIAAEEFDMAHITESITNAIHNLPATISTAWAGLQETIGSIFKSDKEPLSQEMADILNDATISDEYKDRMKKEWTEAGYDISRTVNDPTIWDDLKNIGQVIGQGISDGFQWGLDNIGPFLLTSFSNTVSLVSKAFESLTSFLSGETDDLGTAIDNTIDQNVSEENKGILKTIGEALSNLFLHTLPNLIGSAIGTLVADLPGMWDEFWSGLIGAFKKSGDDATKDLKGSADAAKTVDTTVENASTSLGMVSEKIDEIINGFEIGALTTGAGIIVGLFVVMKIFETIKELISTFNITGNMAEKAEAKNSIEAVFKRMLTALIAGMALVVYASTLNDDQFDKAKTILDKIAEVFYVLSGIYGTVKIVDDITELKNGAKASDGAVDAVDTTVSNWQKIKDALSEGLFGGLKIAGISGGIALGNEMIGSSISDVIGQLTSNFTDAGAAVDTFANTIGSAIETLNSVKDNVETAIETLGSVIDLIGKMKEIGDQRDSVQTARKVIRNIRLSLGSFANIFEGDFKTVEIIGALHDIMGMTGEMETFAQFVESDGNPFGVFKEAIASLGSAMSFYDGINLESSITTTGIENAITILKSILENDDLLGLASKLTPEQFGVDSTEMFEASERIIVFATALAKIGSAFKGFDTTAAEGFKQFIEAVQGMSLEDVVTESSIGGEDAGLVGFAEKMSALGDGLSAFAMAIGDFEESDVSDAEYALNMIEKLAEKLNDVGQGFFSRLFNGGTSITDFSLQLSTLGYNLQKFMEYMHPIADENGKISEWNFTHVETAMYALNKIASAASLIDHGNGVKNIKSLLEKNGSIGSDIAGFMEKVGAFQITHEKIDIDKIHTLLSAFNEFGQAINAMGSIGGNLQVVFEALTGNGNFRSMGGYTTVIAKLMNSFGTISEAVRNGVSMVNKNGEELGRKKIDLDSVKEVFNIIRQLFDTIAASFSVYKTQLGTGYIEALSGETMMTTAIQAMQTLIDNVAILTGFMDTLGSYEDDEKLQKAKDTMAMLADFGSMMKSFSGLGSNILSGQDPETIANGLNTVLTAINMFMAENNNEAVFQETGGKMAAYIVQGIQIALDSDDAQYHPTIHPVFDDESIKQQMADLFGVENTKEFNLSAGFAESVRQAFGGSETFTSISSAVTEIKQQLVDYMQPIYTTVGSLQGEMTSVKNAIGSMAVYLNKNTLVGELTPAIQEEMDNEFMMYSGHVTTYRGSHG